MKRLVITILAFSSLSSGASAWIKKSNQPPPPQPLIERPLSFAEERCSGELYSQLSTFESYTDEACMQGRVDRQFQACAVDLARGKFGSDDYIAVAGFFCAREAGRNELVIDCTLSLEKTFGERYRDYALFICKQSSNPTFDKCITDLYLNGGQEVENSRLATDALRLCKKGTNDALNRCIVNEFKNNKQSAERSARVCQERHDAEVKARIEAEKRRLEAERKAAEERRRQQEEKRKQDELKRKQDEQRRAEEQRRKDEEARNKDKGSSGSVTTKPDDQRKQDELKRKQEEQKRKEDEERRKKEEEDKKKNEPVNPPLPTPLPSNGDDGVIVDLPMFE